MSALSSGGAAWTGRAPRAVLAALVELAVPAFLVFATAFLVRNEPRVAFANRDCAVYAIAARMWSRGEIPYRDFIDHKPPAVYAFYRLFFRVGGPSPRSIWQGMTVLAGIASLALYGGFRVQNRVAAAVGTPPALFLLLVTDALGLGFDSQNNTESLAVVWAVVSFSLLLVYGRWRRLWWPLLAGGAFGVSLLSKQPSALWALPLAVQILAVHALRPWRRYLAATAAGLVAFGVGTAMVLAACVGYFALHGAVSDLYEWTYTRNIIYARLERPDWTPHVRLLKANLEILACKLSVASTWSFSAALVLSALVVVLRRSWMDLVLVVWCATSLMATALGLGFQNHYLVFLFVPLALAVGVALDGATAIVGRAPTRVVLAAAIVFITAVYGPWFLALGHSFASRVPGSEEAFRRSEYFVLGQAMRDQTVGETRVFVFGDPLDPVFYSGLLPSGRYIYYPSAALQPRADDYMRELRETRPRFVFVGRSTYGEFESTSPGIQGALKRYLDAHYERVLEQGPGRLYRLRDSERVPEDPRRPGAILQGPLAGRQLRQSA